MKRKEPKLILFDLDNSLFCWISMYASGTKKSIEKAAEITGIAYETLCNEYKEILDKEDSIEYPFVMQQLPSIMEFYDNDVQKILNECAEPAREAFKLAAYPFLKPYSNVIKTIQTLKEKYPDVKLAILTDAPHRVGLWRLFRLGILNYFDGVYGLEDPKLPVISNEVFVTKHTLIKNLDQWLYGFIGKHQAFPNSYRKPGSKGFKYALNDLDIEIKSKQDVIFVGDNVFKDIQLAKDLGNITSAWCKYGTEVDSQYLEMLEEVSPERFIHKGINLKSLKDYPKADYIFEDFSDLLKLLPEV